MNVLPKDYSLHISLSSDIRQFISSSDAFECVVFIRRWTRDVMQVAGVGGVRQVKLKRRPRNRMQQQVVAGRGNFERGWWRPGDSWGLLRECWSLLAIPVVFTWMTHMPQSIHARVHTHTRRHFSRPYGGNLLFFFFFKNRSFKTAACGSRSLPWRTFASFQWKPSRRLFT